MNREFEYRKVKLGRDHISQIEGISRLQNTDFEDTMDEVLSAGINFKNVGFALNNRALLINSLDNRLMQIYPFLNKNYQYSGVSASIFDKLVHLYVDFSPFLMQKNAFQLNNNTTVLKSGVSDAFKFVELNFNEEFNQIKAFLMNTYRNKATKCLFSTISTHQKTITDTIKSIDTICVTETEENYQIRKARILEEN